jgi:hypothetical protein
MMVAFTREAAARDITLADAKKADYLVRGYVTAYPTEAGTAVSFVYDVFDAKKNRAQRLEDSVIIKSATAGDPWSGVEPTAIASFVTKSADDLAAFLATTPEALAKAQPAAATVSNGAPTRSAPAEGRTIVQKTPPISSASAPKASDVNIAALH